MDTVLYFPRDQFSEHLVIAKRDKVYAEFGIALRSCDACVTVKQAKSFIDFWEPVACIVNNDTLPVGVFRGIPSVFCHRDPKTLPPGSILFDYDENAIARMAVRELLRYALASYCYVPDGTDEYWARERMQGFLRAMGSNFKLKCTSVCPVRSKSVPQIQKSVSTHLLKLPKPIGVFTANDITARIVADACSRARLAIPDDVVLLGVDNNISICESTDISISSIKLCSLEEEAQTFARFVRELLSGSRHETKIIHCPPVEIVRRASTMRFPRSDREVLSAMDLIRRRACDGLTANEVVATFSCSRRMAEIRFRAATGHSILDEIQDVRLNWAKELRFSKLKADEIAARCGYRSRSSVFRLLAKNS